MCSNKKNDRGAVLVLAAVLIVVFIGVAALAVDLGQLHIAKARAQHVCDASALAGAWYLEPGDPGLTIDDVKATAQDLATTNNESDNRKVLQTGTDDQGVTVRDVLGKSITVEGEVKVNFGFATYWGFDSSRVKASSKAMLDNNLGFVYRFVPLAVTDNKVKYLQPNRMEMLSTPWWNTGKGRPDGAISNLHPVTFGDSQYSEDIYRGLLAGDPLLAPFSVSTDSKVKRIMIEGGSDVVDFTLWDLQSRLDSWSWDTWQYANEAQKAASKRVLVIPVVRYSDIAGNATALEVVGFTGFFIDSVADKTITQSGFVWHRTDVFGYFLPGIVGSKSIRWMQQFQPDQGNLLYRVRLTK